MVLHLSTEEKALADKFAADRGKFVTEGLKQGIVYLKEGNFNEANLFTVKKILPLYNQAKTSYDDLIKYQFKMGVDLDEANEKAVSQSKRLSIFTIILSLVLLILLAWWIINTITRSLSEGLHVADSLAGGDLNVDINVTSTR